MELVLEMKECIVEKRMERIFSMVFVFVLVFGLMSSVCEKRIVQMQTAPSENSEVISDNETTVPVEETAVMLVEEIEVVPAAVSDIKIPVVPEIVPDEGSEVIPEVIPNTGTTLIPAIIPDEEDAVISESVPEIEIPAIPEIIPGEGTAVVPEINLDEGTAVIPEINPDEGTAVIPEINLDEETAVIPDEETAIPEDASGTEITVIPEISGQVTEEVVPAVSPFLIDEAGMIYGFLPEYAVISNGYLELPSEGCIGIRRGTFAGCAEMITEIMVPAGIVQIEEGSLNELVLLEWITAAHGNPNYLTKDGVLFNCTGNEILSYPPARVGAYFVPSEVTDVAENAFLNTSLSIIDTRACGLPDNCLLNISESCSIIE